MSDSIVPVL